MAGRTAGGSFSSSFASHLPGYLQRDQKARTKTNDHVGAVGNYAVRPSVAAVTVHDL